MKSTPEAGELRERALALLARREHSRAEITRKLEHAGFAREDIAPLLDEFEARNWLSDRRFAESWVADHRAKAGSVKLAYELRQRGVCDSVIESVLGECQESEIERAREIWHKKFTHAPTEAREKSRQIRFMQGRGFSAEIIRKVLHADSED